MAVDTAAAQQSRSASGSSTKNNSRDGDSKDNPGKRGLNDGPNDGVPRDSEEPRQGLWKRTWNKAVKRPARRVGKLLDSTPDGIKLVKSKRSPRNMKGKGVVDMATASDQTYLPYPYCHRCPCLGCATHTQRFSAQGGASPMNLVYLSRKEEGDGSSSPPLMTSAIPPSRRAGPSTDASARDGPAGSDTMDLPETGGTSSASTARPADARSYTQATKPAGPVAVAHRRSFSDRPRPLSYEQSPSLADAILNSELTSSAAKTAEDKGKNKEEASSSREQQSAPVPEYPSDRMFDPWPPTLAAYKKRRDELHVARQGGWASQLREVSG